MLDNNTSCFNYRIVDGTDHLSKHALGCAIDINPFYNPYVVFGKGENNETYISPAGSEIYADRSGFPYKIDENDLCYRLLKNMDLPGAEAGIPVRIISIFKRQLIKISAKRHAHIKTQRHAEYFYMPLFIT